MTSCQSQPDEVHTGFSLSKAFKSKAVHYQLLQSRLTQRGVLKLLTFVQQLKEVINIQQITGGAADSLTRRASRQPAEGAIIKTQPATIHSSQRGSIRTLALRHTAKIRNSASSSGGPSAAGRHLHRIPHY